MKGLNLACSLASLLPAALACDGCYGPATQVEHVRHVKRIQPGAREAAYGSTRPLEWGQLNVMHTTDTHGWLEGHIKEQNYGADWGDYVSFARHMKRKAANMSVDLLIVDTGDLHDGTGLSDTTSPDGRLSNRVFEELNYYDLLTIGNHELYVSEVAYQAFNEFSKFWGDRYLTSNVQIQNPSTGAWEYIGKPYKYLTTAHGLRIMAFGILFDFKSNANNTKVIPTATMVKQEWFMEAVNGREPVDLFLLLGHNPARPSAGGSTFGTVFDAIRAVHPHIPIQIFGGHSHIRDFAILDQSSTALEAGRYCETLGWFSMSGFDSSNSGYHGAKNPGGVSNPTRKATNLSTAPFVYSRRYLDWNRYTFQYHATGKQEASEFDYSGGLFVTDEIALFRQRQKLGELYGCVPETYCMTCVPFDAPNSIFTVLSDAMATVVVNSSRSEVARMVYSNTGGIRMDMYKGPFTYDDSFIVSPFDDVFMYIPKVPYSHARDLLARLNASGAGKKKRADFASMRWERDACVNPVHDHGSSLEVREVSKAPGVSRRQVVETAGYTTTDDFGTDGDDTAHSGIPSHKIPNFFMGTAGFPESGDADVVDVIFVDFILPFVLKYLGPSYTEDMVAPYISANFTTHDYLLEYAKQKWQAGMPECPF